MRALQFDHYGDPDVLTVTEVPDPTADEGHAVIAVKAGSVNPSDLKNVAGAMQGTVLPRTPGRDYAGIVTDGPANWVGAEVWGTGGDIGFTLDGSHAQKIRVPVSALARKPATLSFEQAASVGVNFVVGWLGAVETAALQSGETIAVIGVSGGVGGAVAQIAHHRGAHVIGLDRHHPTPDTPAAEIITDFVQVDDDPNTVAEELHRVTAGHGAQVVFDAVGGVTTPAALASLARGGRLVVISAVGTRTAEIDLLDFYHRELRMLGADSRQLDAAASAQRLVELTPHFERREFQPLPVAELYTLDDGPAAYRAVAGGTRGRVVINP